MGSNQLPWQSAGAHVRTLEPDGQEGQGLPWRRSRRGADPHVRSIGERLSFAGCLEATLTRYGINLPWVIWRSLANLCAMPTKRVQPPKGGRPVGAKSTDPAIAIAFGRAVVALRLSRGLSQEGLALKAMVDRSFMGRLERAQNVPNLVGVVKLAAALNCSAATLIKKFEAEMAAPESQEE